MTVWRGVFFYHCFFCLWCLFLINQGLLFPPPNPCVCLSNRLAMPHRNICAPQVDNADLVFHSNAVKAVHFSPSGRYLCSGGVDCMLIVWDLQTGKKVTASVPKLCSNDVGVYSPQRLCVAPSNIFIFFIYPFLVS